MGLVRYPGAYGFRIVASDPGVVLPGLVEVPEDATAAHVSWETGPIRDEVVDITDDAVRIAVPDIVAIGVERATSRVSITLPDAPRPEAIVHPMLTTPLAFLARWRGHACLHAGAIAHDGGAVVVCGNQGAGKSTTLATLAEQGLPVIADDLVVIDDGHVLSGPSCVDLRSDAAERFPNAEYLGTIGARERFRLLTPPAPYKVPLRGIFRLEWSTTDAAEVRPLELAERLQVIDAYDYAGVMGIPDPEALLRLADVPMWALSRPRDLATSPRALELMREPAATATPATPAG